MIKQKKHTLAFSEVPDYLLLGICSHHRDYRLVWSINEKFNFDFIKCEEDFELYKKGEVYAKFGMYCYKNQEEFESYYIIKNKQNSHFLIPEKPTIDYFLFICENHQFEIDELIEKLKSLSSVLGVYVFEPSDIKSTEMIIFD